MTTITILAGERTIGGTHVVIEEAGARLIFDIGIAHDPAADPFAHALRRPWRGLADLIDLGMVPFVPGLFEPSAVAHVVRPPDLAPVAGPLVVAMSHSHLDHSHLLGFVRPEVPVYASPPTARIVQVLSDAGSSLGRLSRPLSTVPPGETFQVGPLRVRMLPVDHDVSGASGLIIQAPDGVIAYSGDIRLHGRHPVRSLTFAQQAREAGARLLILEGTRLSPPTEVPPAVERVEADVAPAVAAILRQYPSGLGLILLTPEHGERVEEVARAAAAVDRLFVIDLEGLAFATAALGRPLAVPHGVYLPSWTRRAQEAGESLPPSLQSALDRTPRFVAPEELRARPEAYLLRLAFERFADLLDIVVPGTGGVIISSNGPPLGQYDPAWKTLEWWAIRLSMAMAGAHSTGHAAPRDLALLAAHSGAPTVMAIHSRFPELMPIPPERILLPERGRRYELADLPAPPPLGTV